MLTYKLTMLLNVVTIKRICFPIMTHKNPLRFCQVLIPPYHTLLFNQNCFRKSKLLIMDKSNPSAGQFPSAPPLEHPTPPTVQFFIFINLLKIIQLETVTPLQGANYGQPPQDQPPPSYQVNCQICDF